MLKRTIMVSMMALAVYAVIGCQPKSSSSQSTGEATPSVQATGSETTQSLGATGSATDSAAATDSSSAATDSGAATSSDSD